MTKKTRNKARIATSSEPMRMCVICRGRFNKGGLSRYVLAPDGNLELDARGRKPGRGWYCCADPRCAARFAVFRPKRKRASRNGGKAAEYKGGV